MHYITVQYNNLIKNIFNQIHIWKKTSMKIWRSSLSRSVTIFFGLWNCQTSPVQYTYIINNFFINRLTEVSNSRETVGREVIVLLLRPETPDGQRWCDQGLQHAWRCGAARPTNTPTPFTRTPRPCHRPHTITINLSIPLQSSAAWTWVIPCTHNTFGDNSFTAASPQMWNDLQSQLQQNISYTQVKWLVELGLISHRTHYRSYQRQAQQCPTNSVDTLKENR